MTTEFLKNSASDEDVQAIVEEIEQAFATETAAKAEASKNRKREVQAAENRAKSLGILPESLKTTLAVRKLQAQIEARVGKLPPNQIEVFEDYIGQLSFLKPEAEGDTPAKTAAKKAKKRIAETTASEQKEGAKVLDQVGGAKH
jgi:hypothetical protein